MASNWVDDRNCVKRCHCEEVQAWTACGRGGKKMGKITEKELEFVVRNYETMTFAQMGKALGRHKDTLQRYLRQTGRAKRKVVEIADRHYQYVLKNHTKMTIGAMARNLEVPYERVRMIVKACGVEKQTKRREKIQRGVVRKNTLKENPNPVTMLTRKLICRYDFEGLNEKQIFALLGRPAQLQKRVIDECKKSGEYEVHNAFGKEGRKDK